MSAKSYRILIAEDDALISESLKDHLIDLGHKVIGIASSKDEAIPFLEEQPDFCFLDIRMHGKDEGFEIAQIIRDQYFIPFMFLTSFSDEETVRKASQYHPSGYLLKPFKEADIFSSLEVAMAKASIDNSDKIHIKDGVKKYFIPPAEVLFVKADNVYVEVHTKSKRYLERISLDKFQDRLPDYFVKCHRSYVINSKEITSIASGKIQIGDSEIPMSRTYKLVLG